MSNKELKLIYYDYNPKSDKIIKSMMHHASRPYNQLGNFLFGGSDFVILFQETAGFEITATSGIHLLMGEKYGVMKGNQ